MLTMLSLYVTGSVFHVVSKQGVPFVCCRVKDVGVQYRGARDHEILHVIWISSISKIQANKDSGCNSIPFLSTIQLISTIQFILKI